MDLQISRSNNDKLQHKCRLKLVVKNVGEGELVHTKLMRFDPYMRLKLRCVTKYISCENI